MKLGERHDDILWGGVDVVKIIVCYMKICFFKIWGGGLGDGSE